MEDELWTNAAEDVATACFLAAATSGGSLTDVADARAAAELEEFREEVFVELR